MGRKDRKKEEPLQVLAIYHPPPGSEDGWLRALQILMAATEEEESAGAREEE